MSKEKDIVDILKEAGYKVTEDIDQILTKGTIVWCSGFKIFPDGTKCEGCPDCQGELDE